MACRVICKQCHGYSDLVTLDFSPRRSEAWGVIEVAKSDKRTVTRCCHSETWWHDQDTMIQDRTATLAEKLYSIAAGNFDPLPLAKIEQLEGIL